MRSSALPAGVRSSLSPIAYLGPPRGLGDRVGSRPRSRNRHAGGAAPGPEPLPRPVRGPTRRGRGSGMTVPMRCRFRPGGKIGPNHTVLAVVDKAPGRHPVLIVWDHRSWCPMACKLFASPEKAAEEARILSALNHPNIVRLFEIGEDAELFIEFVDGATLGALMDRHEEGRFRISDALRIAIHLGAALEHMHARGFVHLDLVPSNVI